MADISSVEYLSRDVKIKHPGTDRFIGLTLIMRCVDDPVLASERRRIADRRMQLSARGKQFTVEEIEANQNNLLSKAIEGWIWSDDEDGVPGSFKGKQPEYNRANLKELFEAAPWIKDQASAEFSNTEDFFKS